MENHYWISRNISFKQVCSSPEVCQVTNISRSSQSLIKRTIPIFFKFRKSQKFTKDLWTWQKLISLQKFLTRNPEHQRFLLKFNENPYKISQNSKFPKSTVNFSEIKQTQQNMAHSQETVFRESMFSELFKLYQIFQKLCRQGYPPGFRNNMHSKHCDDLTQNYSLFILPTS